MLRAFQKIWPFAFSFTLGACALVALASPLSADDRLLAEAGPSGVGPSPEVAEAYALLEGGDSQAALRLFDSALEQNAQDLPARLGQALIYAEQRRYADAFSSYDLIVQDYPQHAFAWNGRGLAAFNMEDFDEALNSFERATADMPMNGFFYESLAWTHMCRGEFSESVQAAKQATLIYQQNGESPAYPLLIAYFSSIETGDLAGTARTLRYAIKNRPTNQRWPAPVFDFLAGRIEQNQLLSFVTDKAQETEAHTYIGLHLRAEGDPDAAKKHLDWVANKGDPRVFEYSLARSLSLGSEEVALR
jgi:tetratricopeptide (TPR) repeat protein